MNREFEYDVIVFGTVCLDVVWLVNALPAPDGFASILFEKEMIGGEACNTAIALHIWGAKVKLVGNSVGLDERGKKLFALFERDVPGLSLQDIKIDHSAKTPFCACIATPDGNRTMFGTGFDELNCATISEEEAKSARYFTMDPNGWRSGIEAAEVASRAGCKVVSMDYAESESTCMLSEFILTSHNKFHGADLEVLKSMAKELSQKNRKRVIITCGDMGSIYADSENLDYLLYPALPVAKLVDSTGAGDIFRAGILYGLISDWEITRTIPFAITAASLNCEQPGGWGGIRSLEDTLIITDTRGRFVSKPIPFK